jgi:hypothetical protein
VQNASTCAKSFLEPGPPIHSPTHFTDTLDSVPECHFRFLNEQKQALGDLKNTKRGKNTWLSEISQNSNSATRVVSASHQFYCTVLHRQDRGDTAT